MVFGRGGASDDRTITNTPASFCPVHALKKEPLVDLYVALSTHWSAGPWSWISWSSEQNQKTFINSSLEVLKGWTWDLIQARQRPHLWAHRVSRDLFKKDTGKPYTCRPGLRCLDARAIPRTLYKTPLSGIFIMADKTNYMDRQNSQRKYVIPHEDRG